LFSQFRNVLDSVGNDLIKGLGEDAVAEYHAFKVNREQEINVFPSYTHTHTHTHTHTRRPHKRSLPFCSLNYPPPHTHTLPLFLPYSLHLPPPPHRRPKNAPPNFGSFGTTKCGTGSVRSVVPRMPSLRRNVQGSRQSCGTRWHPKRTQERS
jgi:hypothetical protein